MGELVPKQELRKHVGAIHVSNAFSLMQRKLWNVALYFSYEHLLDREEHEIPIGLLAEYAGFNSHNRAKLKAAVKQLTQTLIEWNILDDSGQEEEWTISTALSAVTFRAKDGMCIFSFSPPLRKKLYQPAVYAKIDLKIVCKFNSGYALALYENCFRFKNVKTTGWMSLTTFKKLMGVDGSAYYRNYFRLNQKIIIPAVQEVNEVSDIVVAVEYKRSGRFVDSLKFNISVKPTREETPQGVGDVVDIQQDNSGLQNRLVREYGLSEAQVKNILAKHKPIYILEVLAKVDREKAKGKIKNLAAFTLRAIEDDYREASEGSPINTQVTARKARIVELKAQIADADKAFHEEHTEAIKALVGALDETSRTDLDERFRAHLTKESSLIAGLYRQEGLSSTMVWLYYMDFVATELGEVLDDIETWAIRKGINYHDMTEELRSLAS
jgi:plasmid replication initiation protein